MAKRISLIYCSASFNNTYNMWNEFRLVLYLLDKSNAKVNIDLDLSENSFIILSILNTYYLTLFVYVLINYGFFNIKYMKCD